MSEQPAGRIDAALLPEGLVALIDALGSGEDLLITRNGEPIATISSARGAFGAETADTLGRHHSTAEGSPAGEDVTVVATAMKLSESARSSLSDKLGPDYIVLDMKSAPKSVDVLLVPPISPQLIGSFRAMFPKARVIITEIEDSELGVSYQGPVRRLLNAGADSYLPPSTIPRLAEHLDRTVTHLNQLTGDAVPPLTIESPHVENG
ncbi:hypothetical protein MUY14_05000 [Amycolatopsis sp. FBCC-B4732]|uniref:hypothetical protein n=1 Tax=Amycolatopsis sp. FBCC-B4732 TaxID=3079339 RepID=UPI001FF6A015|nr:hypothetical protein [Amycolatopsis sp. FBCC-B4732]UOX89996.1 hypothetical protein MUY14_05000 [Amycolatopsis sp. FBCC-B4732]